MQPGLCARYCGRETGLVVGGFDLILTAVADFNAANAVVEATHRHKEIFYDE